MEKEISSVLSMMIKPKTPDSPRHKDKRLKVDEYMNDVDKISEEVSFHQTWFLLALDGQVSKIPIFHMEEK